MGGSRINNSNTGVALRPEVWDPETDTWTVLRATATPRLYHSTTLLLPDGSVYAGGGGAPGPQNNLDAEVFFPPYLYQGDGQPASRPVITSAPEAITYDQRFTIEVDRQIDRVTLVKSGNNTHSMSTQIFQELPFTQTGGQLQVDSPDFATVATPGRYMLFALDQGGVPSEARIVTLSGPGLTPPQPRQLPPNLLANGGFEAPNLPGDAGFAVVATPNWTSTRGDQALELWDAGHQEIGAAEGDQFTELNVSEPVTISQAVTVVPGATYRWSFEHRGRQNEDTVEVVINGQVEATITTGPGAWRPQSGTYVAPADASTVDFALRAVDPGGSGNLVDDVRLAFVADPPADEVEASGTVTEDGGGPIAGVVIDLFTSGRTSWLGSTTTDQAGVYRFSIEPNTCYTLTFTAPTGRSLIGPGTNSDGRYQNRDFCVQDQSITGLDTQVTAGDDGSPEAEGAIVDGAGVGIGGVTIDLFQAAADGSRGPYLTSTTTGPGGTYRFDLPSAGCYIHTAISPDDRTFTATGSRFANIAYCAANGETVVGLDATLTGGASTIGGQVVEVGGNPVMGVTVDLFTATPGGDRTAFVTATNTDQSGSHRFSVGPGCYVQVAIAPAGRSFVATGTGFQEGFACVGGGETDTSFLAILNAD